MATVNPRINLNQLETDLRQSQDVTIFYVTDGREEIFRHERLDEVVCIELHPRLVVKRLGCEDLPGGRFEVPLADITKIVISDAGVNPISFWGTWKGDVLRRFTPEK